MKACANLHTLFVDLPFMDRFAAAKAVGFDGVEVPFPYDAAVPEMLDQLGRHDLKIVMIACPPPNYTGADRGFAAVPGLEERFQRDFKRTMRYAKALNVTHVHVMSGAIRGPEARETLIANLRWALDAAPDQRLTIEPMSIKEVPGYYLNNVRKARDILNEIGEDRLGLQFDLHHVHQIHEDVSALWQEVAEDVRHIQIAQYPDRRAPLAKGDIDVARFLAQVRASKYKGWIAGEYFASPDDLSHTAWLS